MVVNSDIKLFNIVFGDLSDLTPLQRLDLVEWYFHGDNNKKTPEGDTRSVRSRVQWLLRNGGDYSVAVMINRLRYKLGTDALEKELETMVKAGEIIKGKSKIGKDLYSIARGKK